MTYIEKQELDDNTNEFYDISTGDIKTLDINNINKLNLHENRNIYFLQQWNQRSGGSTPPDNGSYIYVPNNYETGYSSYTSNYCTNYNRVYSIMADFSSGGVCAPTAATNLMNYYYNGRGYFALNPGSWQTVFNYMFSSMGTTMNGGTINSNIKTGISTYVHSRGYSAATSNYYTGTSSGAAIVTQINSNYAAVLSVHGHSLYGDHSVLALRYQKYTYSSSSSIYICIADGWSPYPDRGTNNKMLIYNVKEYIVGKSAAV